MPFYGEAAALDWANVTAGSPFADAGDAIRYRAETATVTAGDVFVAGFFDSGYLTGADAATFAVAIVHTSGSATLRISGGPDADWSLGDINASAYALGDHAVSGSGVLAVNLTWVTVADYLTQAVETAVRVEVLSGSLTIQQVKLRIWPPGGALGGWSDVYPGWSSGGYTAAVRYLHELTLLNSGPAVDTSAEGAWDAANAAVVFDDTTGTTYTTGAGSGAGVSGGATILALGGSPFQWQAGISAGAFVEVYRGVDWRNAYPILGLTPDVDFIVPPDEVPDDVPSTLVQQTGTGSTEWVGTSSTVGLSAAVDLVGFVPTIHSVGSDDVTTTFIAGPLHTVTGAGYTQGGPVGAHGGSPSTAGVTLNDDGAAFIIVSRGYSYTPQSWPGWAPAVVGTSISESVNQDVSFPDLESRAVLPPYRVWDPNAVTYRPLRQWPLDEGNGGTPRRIGGRSNSRRTSGNARGYQ